MNRPPLTLFHVRNSLRIALGLLFIATTSWLPAPLGSNVRDAADPGGPPAG